MSEGYAKPVTAMTVADLNSANEKLWGNIGPANSPAEAVPLAGTKVSRGVPVYTGGGVGDGEADAYLSHADHPEPISGRPAKPDYEGPSGKPMPHEGSVAHAAGMRKKADDEVSPTQSDPEDRRSDNLLDREDGGIPGTEPLNADGKKKSVGSSYKEIHNKLVASNSLSSNGKYSEKAPKTGAGDETAEEKKEDREDEETEEEMERYGTDDDLVEGSEAMEVREHGWGDEGIKGLPSYNYGKSGQREALKKVSSKMGMKPPNEYPSKEENERERNKGN